MTTPTHRPARAQAWTLALALLCPYLAPSKASASAPTTEEAEPTPTLGSVHVELRTRDLTPKFNHQLTEQFHAKIEDRVTMLGLALETTPAADFVVQIEISEPQAHTQLYVIQSVAVIAGEVAIRGEVQSCIECSAAVLVERGLELLPDATEAMLAAKRAAEREAAEARRAAERAAAAPAPEVERERLPRTMGYVGISVSALGLGSTIAGAALLAPGERPDETCVNVIGDRTPGWALVGVGVAAMVAGNVLLAVDLGRSRRRRVRSRSRARTLAVGPRISNAPGLLVRGHF